jgi:gamma-polyglutamate synthase
MLFSACALAGLVALGGWERLQRDRAQREIPVRIHVNGTRGKSTVTRMIAAALRASGRRTLAKSTGTAARLILPDGREREVRRRSRPSIREQLWFLREARRLGVDAIVLECMALDPVLQHVSEYDMIAATIGVITNARLDHADVMGTTTADVASALANTVPRSGVLVLGDVGRPDVFAAAAAASGCRVVRPSRPEAEPDTPAWVTENLGLALAVTRELGIPDDVARPAMRTAPGDPGALSRHTWRAGARSVEAIDASSANDPESLQRLLADVREDGRLFVFNHRGDRPTRLAQFSASPLLAAAGSDLLITGDPPAWSTRRTLRLTRGGRPLEFISRTGLARAVGARIAGDASTVILCGNARGLDVPALLASLVHT